MAADVPNVIQLEMQALEKLYAEMEAATRRREMEEAEAQARARVSLMRSSTRRTISEHTPCDPEVTAAPAGTTEPDIFPESPSQPSRLARRSKEKLMARPPVVQKRRPWTTQRRWLAAEADVQPPGDSQLSEPDGRRHSELEQLRTHDAQLQEQL